MDYQEMSEELEKLKHICFEVFDEEIMQYTACDAEALRKLSKAVYNEVKKNHKPVGSYIRNYKGSFENMIDELGIDRESEFSDYVFLDMDHQSEESSNKANVVVEELKSKGSHGVTTTYLYLDINILENQFKKQDIILKMSYNYLHTIMDEFLLCQIDKVLYYRIEILSNKTITLKDIQKYESLEDVREHFIDGEVENLSHGSFEDKVKFFQDRGIEFKKDTIDELILFSEIRNAIAHTSLRVNKKIQDKLKKTKYKDKYSANDVFELDIMDFNKFLDAVTLFSNGLEMTVFEKFEIPSMKNERKIEKEYKEFLISEY